MSQPAQNYFLETIHYLRNNEEILLFNKLIDITPAEEALVIELLETEYANERLDYPNIAPAFDKAAALWSAKTIYIAAQLLLYREHKPEDVITLLAPYTNSIDAEAIVSADLCLRFLPHIIQKAKLIDADDILIELLENHLQVWHYSGIGYPLEAASLALDTYLNNPCLKRLYIDRVIEYRDKKRLLAPGIEALVKADLGNFTSYFWKELV
jgi:hypothetical protein